jgi:NADPH:quinone reductase-like Zn-dependent oxidoreductase
MLSSSSPSFEDELRQAVGEGVQVALDTAGGPLFDLALNSLATGGRTVVITTGRDPQTKVDLLRLYRKDLRLLGLNTLNLDAVASANILKEAVRPIEVGWLKPRDIQTYALTDAVRAYGEPQSGKIRVLVNLS